MKTLHVNLLCILGIFLNTHLVHAQAIDNTFEKYLILESQISSSTCAVTFVQNGVRSNYVFQLPPLKTIALKDSLFSPVTQFELDLKNQFTNALCANNPNTPMQLVFDSALAAIAPRSGLLRNTAPERPAQNVFVQIGLIDPSGGFQPIDLNQPQLLNQALNTKNNSSENRLNLTFGVRYVTAQTLSTQNASLSANTPGSQDVSAGNIAVFLPFLLKLN